MDKIKKGILIVLIVLNGLVLLGQAWPEGAPPFAKTITLAFLVLTLLYLVYQLIIVMRKR